MQVAVEKVYTLPISSSKLYDIEYITALRLIKTVKRRSQSEKSYQRYLTEIKNTIKSPMSFRLQHL